MAPRPVPPARCGGETLCTSGAEVPSSITGSARRGWLRAVPEAPQTRFLSAGLLAVVADYGTFAVAHSAVHVDLRVATVASYLAGFVVSFCLNKFWVFGSRGDSLTRSIRQLLLYVLLLALNMAFTYYFIRGLEDLLRVDPLVGKLIAIGIVTAVNYVLYSRVIFAERSGTCGA